MICPACRSPNADDAKFCGACGRSLALPVQSQAVDLSSMYTVDSNIPGPITTPSVLVPGQLFAGRYQVTARLDGVGNEDRYLVHDNISHTDMALKLIRVDGRLGSDFRSRLLRDATAARDIRHPNIAAVYDVGEADGQVYATMETLDGVSLQDWNRRRLTSNADLGLSSIAAMIFAILDALVTIHIRNLVRVDLKPANIMLLSDPTQPGIRLKLLDVGLPSLSDASEATATSYGANAYRAPEALTSGAEALSPSADIYSIAMLFYELLTGVPLAGHWQPPSTGRTDVPPAIDALIQNGLSNNPRRRPQSAADFKQALEEAVQTVRGVGPKPAPILEPKPEPKVEPQPEPPHGQKKPVRGWQTVAVVAAIVGVVALAAWGISTLSNGEGEVALAGGPGDETRSPLDGPTQPDRERTNEADARSKAVDPPPASRFERFNGYWTDDFGDTWSVVVNNAGRVQALATGGVFAGTQMAGAFDGPRFEFVVGNAYGSGAAVGTFDGECHIKYQTLDPYGSGRMLNANLHVNHQPGAPCP